MMKFAIAALACALIAAPALADTPSISVTGEATISTPPDFAQIDSGVTSEAKTAREASEANNKAMAAVLAALKSAGVAEKDFQTSRLSLQPQYAQPQPNRNTPPSVVGFRASNRVTVTIRDIAKMGNVIDALTANGANEIGGISFMVSNASKLLDEARPKAIEDARRKADIYAQAAGVSLGTPLSISEEGAPAIPVFRKASMDLRASPAPIAQGEETLRIGVSVTYELKSK